LDIFDGFQLISCFLERIPETIASWIFAKIKNPLTNLNVFHECRSAFPDTFSLLTGVVKGTNFVSTPCDIRTGCHAASRSAGLSHDFSNGGTDLNSDPRPDRPVDIGFVTVSTSSYSLEENHSIVHSL
jgi:hypothetical protein